MIKPYEEYYRHTPSKINEDPYQKNFIDQLKVIKEKIST